MHYSLVMHIEKYVFDTITNEDIMHYSQSMKSHSGQAKLRLFITNIYLLLDLLVNLIVSFNQQIGKMNRT